jgi:hypothetical protein
VPPSDEMPPIGSRMLVISITWGEGTVLAYNPGPTAKQVVVQSDDGIIGNFAVSQVVRR